MKNLGIMPVKELLTSRLDSVARRHQKNVRAKWACLLALGLTALLSQQTARSTPVVITPTNQAQSYIEMGEPGSMAWNVYNPNSYPLALDYAMFYINPAGSPDTAGNVWPGDWFPVIPAFGNQTFSMTFNISGPYLGDTDNDSGLNPVIFSTEWEQVNGTIQAAWTNAPAWSGVIVVNGITNTLAGPVGGSIIDVVGNGSLYVPSATYSNGLTSLMQGNVPTSPLFNGGEISTVDASITVNDIPEPSTLALVFLGAFSLLAYARRQRRTIA